MKIPPEALAAIDVERRVSGDRRNRLWWSLLYGNFHPRRRFPARRQHEPRFHSLDWHSSHLLAVAIAILVLSAADAFMTITLLALGAVEVNPIMGAFVNGNASVFASVKMIMTGSGVALMVILAHYRFLRVVRVDIVLYALLVGYIALLSYEFSMFHAARAGSIFELVG